MTDSSDPPAPRHFNNSSYTKMKEQALSNQLMTCKAPTMQRIIQVVQRVAQKGCRRACEMFCCPLDAVLPERAVCCSDQSQQHTEDKTTQVTLRTLPSTILIVNISNSTLIDCVIGNDTYTSAVAESQPLMLGPKLQMHDQVRCSCSHGQQGAAQTSAPPHPPLCPPLPSPEPPSISIHSSHLNCVIIGDNNYMHADQTHSPETGTSYD